MAVNNLFGVRAGDIWEEVDARFNPPRRVKVLDVGKEYAVIITIKAKYKVRPRKAKLTRFDGKSCNYRLVRHAKKGGK
jgi:hypothetical protein